MKLNTLKKKLMVVGLGVGMAAASIGQASAGWTYCAQLEAKCQAGDVDACASYRYYCITEV